MNTHLQIVQNGRPDDTSVAALKAEVARLRRLLEEAGQQAEYGMVLLAQADVEHLRVEERLERSRRDLEILTVTIPQLLWRSCDDGDWTWASPQWTAYTGQSDLQARGLGWLEVVHPGDRERALQAWGRAEGCDGLELEHRLRRASDGAYRWFQTRSTPRHDTSGRIVEWFGTSTEVHELKTLQEKQRLLLAELQHRVRNTLAVMRLIARRSGETSETVEDYAAHLDGRLNAFSRVQGMLTRDPSAGISLHGLVADELLAHRAREGEGEVVQVEGPEVLLQAKAAEMLGLAVHELTTNAIEHGALTHPRGRIQISWQLEQEGANPCLRFVWAEHGLRNLPSEPSRRGFGLTLLERTLCYELQGHTTLAFESTGLHCTICVPLAGRVAAAPSVQAEALGRYGKTTISAP